MLPQIRKYHRLFYRNPFRIRKTSPPTPPSKTNTAQTPIHNPPSKLLQPNALLNRPKEKRNPFAMFSHGTSAISRPGKAAQTLSGNGFSGGISQGFLNTGKSRRWSP